MPAGCLYSQQTFIDRNPNTVQALTNAMVRANKWIQAAGPSEVIKTVPESQIVETLIEEAMRLAEQQGGTDASAPGSPVVTVS